MGCLTKKYYKRLELLYRLNNQNQLADKLNQFIKTQ